MRKREYVEFRLFGGNRVRVYAASVDLIEEVESQGTTLLTTHGGGVVHVDHDYDWVVEMLSEVGK